MDNVTPLHKGTGNLGDVTKQQMIDSLAQHYDNHSNAQDMGGKPVACFVVMVDESGGAGTSWFIDPQHEKLGSLYIARALLVGQHDVYNYQRCIDEGNHP